jgi:hypothetical protein
MHTNVQVSNSAQIAQNRLLNEGQQYWYVIETTACVLCGREKVNRYRVFEKPKPEQKYIWIDDACGDHFM